MLLLRREHIDRLFDMLIANRRFDTPFKITEYDGGMNFWARLAKSQYTSLEIDRRHCASNGKGKSLNHEIPMILRG